MGEFVHVYNDGGGIRDVAIAQGSAAVVGSPDKNAGGRISTLITGIPFIIPPGDGGAVGINFSNSAGTFALNGAGAIVAGTWNMLKGCWMYMQANFGGSSYPAGWYWAVFSSDTAGILYTDKYTLGKPKRPASPTPFPVNLSGAYTTTTSEVTGPTGIVIPGGSLGPNGSLITRIRTHGNVSVNKTFRIYLGSTCVTYIGTITTNPISELSVSTVNQGSENLQMNSRQTGVTGVGLAGATFTAGTENTSVDTTSDKIFSISMQVSGGTTGCAILSHAAIETTYGAAD